MLPSSCSWIFPGEWKGCGRAGARCRHTQRGRYALILGWLATNSSDCGIRAARWLPTTPSPPRRSLGLSRDELLRRLNLVVDFASQRIPRPGSYEDYLTDFGEGSQPAQQVVDHAVPADVSFGGNWSRNTHSNKKRRSRCRRRVPFRHSVWRHRWCRAASLPADGIFLAESARGLCLRSGLVAPSSRSQGCFQCTSPLLTGDARGSSAIASHGVTRG